MSTVTFTEDDISDRAAVRAARHFCSTWPNGNETRTKLRYTWPEFFKRFDVSLTPVVDCSLPARPRTRTVNVNGKSVTMRGAVIRCRAVGLLAALAALIVSFPAIGYPRQDESLPRRHNKPAPWPSKPFRTQSRTKNLKDSLAEAGSATRSI